MNRLAIAKDLRSVLSQADNLPSLPAVALEVLRLTQDEDATIADLAACVERDPALAARLLKLANSSLFGVGKEITTLQRAAMVLGMKTVKLMSLSFSLVGTLPKRGKESGFDFGEYWSRSLTAAVAARALGQLVKSPAADEAFLCGLLGHIGRPILARCFSTEYAAVLAETGSWPTPEEEQRRLGFCSREAAAALLESWGLPPAIHVTVGHLGRAAELPAGTHPSIQGLLNLLEVASQVEAILCGRDKGQALSTLHDLARRHYGLSPAQIEAYLVALESEIREAGELLSVHVGAGPTHEELVHQARAQLVQLSLGTVHDLQQEKHRNEELENQNRELAVRARTDGLTGLPNRAAFDEFLDQQVWQRLRGGVPQALGLILLDIDLFKRFNDTHGHPAGDVVLRTIGEVLRRLTRRGDLAARYGGEEFAVVVPHATPEGLQAMTERLRQGIEREPVDIGRQKLLVTASFGAACLATLRSYDDRAALIALADRHLYRAKEKGRNCCEVYSDTRLPEGDGSAG